MTSVEKSDWVKRIALEAGFLQVGISTIRRLNEEEHRLQDWLVKGYHGDMTYMANHLELRLDPSNLVPGARSVISLAYNYYRPEETPSDGPKISMYAQGQDYHKVVKKKLKKLWNEIKTQIDPNAIGRYFVDSAPVMERQWAAQSGLGWQGKNTLLIHPRLGSYFFLAEIICDLDLTVDAPIHDHCGTCTRCIDACPTDAIDPQGYLLLANQCISYLTIETKDPIPERWIPQMEGWVFGCDICQQVCPWNKFSTPHSEPLFYDHPDYLRWTLDQWKNLTEEQFEKEFGTTPLKRAGYQKFLNTVKTVINGQGLD